MKPIPPNAPRAARYYIVTALILLTGFGAAIAIYINVGAPASDPFSDYEHSKRYTHNLELNGGRFAVIAKEMKDWFAGLWVGETLAATVAWITVFIAAAYFFVASRLESNARNGEHQDGAG